MTDTERIDLLEKLVKKDIVHLQAGKIFTVPSQHQKRIGGGNECDMGIL